MIWNNSKQSPSKLSRATSFFVVDCCQCGAKLILGLKWSLWPVPTWLAVQRRKTVFFMTLYNFINAMKHLRSLCITTQPCHSHFFHWWPPIWCKLNSRVEMELMVCADLVGSTTEQNWFFLTLYNSMNYIKHSELYASHPSCATAIFVIDCCQFGLSWSFGLKMQLMVCANLVGGTTEQIYFSWTYIIVSMIWNTSKLSASHLSSATAIFVVDWCQFDPNLILGLKLVLMACDDMVGGTTEKSCLFRALIILY